jgi:ubiquinone/menaquinone biosynthesis C-methylase UbiE
MRRLDSLTRITQTGKSVLTLNRSREFSALKQMLDLAPGDNLLDIGCGDGFWTSRMAQDCAQVVGLEPNVLALEYARRFHSLPNVSYFCGVAESLPFRNDSFDKVVSISCLEHFPDPWRGIAEIGRVVKPGGKIALSVDSLLPENSPEDFRQWHKRRHFVTHYFSQGALIQTLESSGLHHHRDRTVHLFRSRIAAGLRQIFIRRPRLWLPLFPAFYLLVRFSDEMFNDMHGQIIIVSASR